jgi:hypothetical protein
VVTDAKTGGHFNRYDYANNNPYRFTDPDGRVPMAVPVVAAIRACAASAACTAGVAALIAGGKDAISKNLAAIVKTINGALSKADEGVSQDKPKAEAPKDVPKGKEKDVPNRGEPGETKEGQRRTREYGQDGKPVRDFDKPHQGYERPHVHEWENGAREHPGRDYSPWPRQGN